MSSERNPLGGDQDRPAVARAERAALVAGVVTAVAGPLLLAAPAPTARLVGLPALAGRPGLLRLVGASDVLTAPGLLVGRPRWPWLAARAGLNVGLVAGALALRRELGPRALVGVAAFGVLSVVDGRAAAVLRGAGR